MNGFEGADAARVVAGRYRLLGPLGRGGMGVVWRARDEVLGREVAVKEVRAPAGLDAAGVERTYRRLEREAWAAARVSHRGVVTVYDVASEDGRPWIVMELVRGLSLAEVLEAEGPMDPRRAAHTGEQVLAALRSAHGSGVLHRDVKPANVLVANDGRVVLGDFGIAGLAGSSPLTMTGELLGSPEFMAPERALGRDPGPESDLWSLGVTLYAAVEGFSPFRRDTPLATLRAVVEGELPPPRRAGALAPVLEGLLRKDPGARLDAAEASRMLRVVGAGGAVRDAGGPVSGPTVPLAHGPGAGGAGAAGAGAGTGAGAATAAGGPYGAPTVPVPASGPGLAEGERQGAAGWVLTVGIVVLLVAVVLLGWLLLRDTPGDTDDRGGTGPSPSAPAPPPAASPPASGSSPSASSSASASPSGPAPRAYAYAYALRRSYDGACPAPEASSPAFAGTVEVDRTPAVVEYRWITRTASTSDARTPWQSLTYEADGPRSRQVAHTEPGARAGGTLRDAVRLEVRSPAGVASPWLEFTMTCREETPTPGTPSPGSTGSPGPSPGTTGPSGPIEPVDVTSGPPSAATAP
ncbi:serine/threonine-protein kinase [Streptomyces sp. NPDC048606]|uniref:serine/threonine-protein kinase n=1 Tax=Streptomyces sp. NPDC048606 TaxID=3154726 RepID=UPI003449C4C7